MFLFASIAIIASMLLSFSIASIFSSTIEFFIFKNRFVLDYQPPYHSKKVCCFKWFFDKTIRACILCVSFHHWARRKYDNRRTALFNAAFQVPANVNSVHAGKLFIDDKNIGLIKLVFQN